MSIEKNMNTRIQHKHDIEANWNKALNFIPKIGEIIVYDIDDNCNYSRFKIGDGVRTINDLEFLLDTQYILHNSNTLSQILEQYRSDIENITFEETDPTVPAWAKAATKPTYTASEVGAPTVDEMNAAIAAIPTPDVSGQINTHNTATDAHSDIRTALNNKVTDYTIRLYNGTGGNPKPVKFLTINYSNCDSNNGVMVKVGMVSGHGNGTSYTFLQDAIINVGYTGTISANNFKYYGAAVTDSGVERQYGDIFWIHDSTNKIVDFYVLMGQYADVKMMPFKRLNSSSGGTVTQHTSCTVYSSGTKMWANNSDIALMSDLSGINLDGYATTDALNTLQAQVDELAASVVTTHSGSENPVAELGEDGDLYLVTE